MVFDTLKTNHRVKHINMRIQAIREHILSGLIAIHFVPTDDNVADILTKALPAPKFQKFRKILMEGHDGLAPDWDHVHGDAHLALTALSILEV